MKKTNNRLSLKTLIFLLLMFSSTIVLAQEKLYLKGKTNYISVKIILINDRQIQYKELNATMDMPIIQTSKFRVIKIVYSNGNVMRFNDDEFYCAENIYGERKFAIKFDQLAFRNSVYFFSSEWNYKRGINFELGAGYINWKDYAQTATFGVYQSQGLLLRAGAKFIKSKDNHAFNGFYLKPEITYINYLNKDTAYVWEPRKPAYYQYREVKYTGLASFINAGYQISFKEMLLFDVFGGVGFGFKTGTNIQSQVKKEYLYLEDTKGFGFVVLSKYNSVGSLAFQAGIKVGIIINKPSKRNTGS